MRRPLGFVGALLLVGVLVASGGCEAIVPDEVPRFTCTGTALSSCPAGQYCKGSGCVPCEGRDVCDGFDNDCNGKVDDGPFSDADSDGYSWCGRVDEATGARVDADCDEHDPTVHPGAKEVCNGRDDDCNGIIDDPGVACPASQTCIPKTKKCVGATETCTPSSCPAPKVCDTDSGQCVDPGVAALGQPCESSKACQSGLCADAAILGADVAKAGAICASACCASSGCPDGFVCFSPGTGGNYCVRAATAGIASALGTAKGGESCDGGAKCRSGSCDATTKRCTDACCSEHDCGGGATCAVGTLFGHPALACRTGAGKGQNERCYRNSECKSGVCVSYPDLVGRCAAPCCGSSSCGSFDVTFFGQPIANQPLFCQDDGLGSSSSVAPLCDGMKQSNGSKRLGDACTSAGECLSEYCFVVSNSERRCSDVCCTDADCASIKWACRPVEVQTGKFFLRCVPP